MKFVVGLLIAEKVGDPLREELYGVDCTGGCQEPYLREFGEKFVVGRFICVCLAGWVLFPIGEFKGYAGDFINNL